MILIDKNEILFLFFFNLYIFSITNVVILWIFVNYSNLSECFTPLTWFYLMVIKAACSRSPSLLLFTVYAGGHSGAVITEPGVPWIIPPRVPGELPDECRVCNTEYLCDIRDTGGRGTSASFRLGTMNASKWPNCSQSGNVDGNHILKLCLHSNGKQGISNWGVQAFSSKGDI